MSIKKERFEKIILLVDLPPFFVPPLKLEFMFRQTVGA
jgi:hypothetical protein